MTATLYEFPELRKMIEQPDGRVAPRGLPGRRRMLDCPNVIALAEHYPPDDGAPCRCFDPHAREMAEWGYEWDEEEDRWVP